MECDAILFDLDGVLVDSAECVRHVCVLWATARGLDPEQVLNVGQGRRVFETVRLVAPHLDPDVEAAALIAMEESTTLGLRAIPGADRLVRAIPEDRWAVVTSGTRKVAELRLRTAGLPIPEVFVTGDDVREGKPDPEGYLAAARRLGRAADACIVIEDAPAGVEAARRAGMRCVALAGTFAAEQLSNATIVVPSLDQLQMRHSGVIELRFGAATKG